MLALFPGDQSLEQELHRRFADLRLPRRREWFRRTAEFDRSTVNRTGSSTEIRPTPKVAVVSFYTWLLDRGRYDLDDELHDLALYVSRDASFPKSAASLKEILDHLTSKPFLEWIIEDARVAWQLWSLKIEELLAQEGFGVPAPGLLDLSGPEMRHVRMTADWVLRDKDVAVFARLLASRALMVEDGRFEGVALKCLLVFLDVYLYSGDFKAEIYEEQRLVLETILARYRDSGRLAARSSD